MSEFAGWSSIGICAVSDYDGIQNEKDEGYATVACSRVGCAAGWRMPSTGRQLALRKGPFFKDFTEAYNVKDVKRIEKMSGHESKAFLRWIKGKEKNFKIDIIDTSAGNVTNVTVNVTVDKGNNKYYSSKVVFRVRKVDGTYLIDEMSLPDSDKDNRESMKKYDSVRQLAAAINAGDFTAVKGLIAVGNGDSANLETELKLRGLLWIKDAIDAGDKIPNPGVGINRAQDGSWIGFIKPKFVYAKTSLAELVS